MARGADASTLQIYVGGEAADFEQMRPVFEAMGDPDKIMRVGAHGAGYAVKLLLNQLWFGSLIAIAEQIFRRARAAYGDAAGEMSPVRLYEDIAQTELRLPTDDRAVSSTP